MTHIRTPLRGVKLNPVAALIIATLCANIASE